MNFHKLVLIGLLFQVFDINIVIDIIPDFIGFIIIAYAFSKRKVRYASLGMYCSVILTISSFIEMWQQTISFYESTNLWVEIIAVVISSVNILYFACIFYVSKEILKIDNGIFPKLFIGAQILMQLVVTFSMHFPFDKAGLFLIPIVFILFFFYIYFVVFLWKRKNIEKKIYKEIQAESH